MGISTNAYLWYGVDFDEGDLPLHFDDKRNLIENIFDSEWENEWHENWRDVIFEGDDDLDWYEFLDALNEIIEKKFGVTISYHCSEDCEMHMIIIKETKHSAWRGYPMEVESTEVKPYWNEQLKAVLEYLQLPWREPKWWLCSYWG